MTFFVISSVLSYLAIAVALQKIAKRLKMQDDWYAWVPVLNLVLLLKVVKKPQSSVFLFFIPIVGFFFSMTVWMELAVTLSKPKWLGVFAAIPFVNIFAILYLAHGDNFSGEIGANIAIIKGSSEAFAYNSKIIEGTKSSQAKYQSENLNQLEKDLQQLQSDSLKDDKIKSDL